MASDTERRQSWIMRGAALALVGASLALAAVAPRALFELRLRWNLAATRDASLPAPERDAAWRWLAAQAPEALARDLLAAPDGRVVVALSGHGVGELWVEARLAAGSPQVWERVCEAVDAACARDVELARALGEALADELDHPAEPALAFACRLLEGDLPGHRRAAWEWLRAHTDFPRDIAEAPEGLRRDGLRRRAARIRAWMRALEFEEREALSAN